MDDNNIVKALISIGKAEQMLLDILYKDCFEDLSKHNPDWKSNENDVSFQLNRIRVQLSIVQGRLWEVINVLSQERDGSNEL